MPQRGATDVFHDDEPTGYALVVNEIENLHDARVGNISQEFALGFCCGGFLGGFLRLHALEHHDAPGNKMIVGQVNPAHAAVGDDPQDLVLLGDDIAGLNCGAGIFFFSMASCGSMSASCGSVGTTKGRRTIRLATARAVRWATAFAESG